MQKKPRVSIIYCLFDFTRTLRHMTMASLSNVRRFTDKEDYEIILVDNVPVLPIRDDYKVLDMDEIKIKVNKKDHGYYKSLNEGAKLAKGDILCFIQPDVFVHEGWLNGAAHYIENDMADVVWPDQFPRRREDILKSYSDSFEEGETAGGREAGCVFIRRSTFEAAGGWDDRLFNEYGEAAMWARLDGAGARVAWTNKSLITHVTAGTRYTMWDEQPDVHNKDMEKDGLMWKKIQDEG